MRSLVDRNQRLTLCVLPWLAQLALVAFLTQALLAKTDLPTDATLATHDSQSLKKMMTASCTLIILAEQHERLLGTRHRVTSQHVLNTNVTERLDFRIRHSQRDRQHTENQKHFKTKLHNQLDCCLRQGKEDILIITAKVVGVVLQVVGHRRDEARSLWI